MEFPRFLDCLAGDFARLRAVVQLDLTADVPTCPGWTVADLTRHVGEVYMHKTLAMREGAEPNVWPPKGLADEEPLALLDRAYDELLHEFSTRRPEDPSGTWYTPDQTVGFWIRRMAHETVIHRIDAELGTGQAVAPIPADLAVDGIDELLKVFVAFGVEAWGDYFTAILAGSPGRTYAVRTDGAAWRVRTGPGCFAVEDGAGDGPVDVLVSGPPAAVLRWVWNRESAGEPSAGEPSAGEPSAGEPSAGEPSAVTVAGAPEAVDELRRCIATATQ